MAGSRFNLRCWHLLAVAVMGASMIVCAAASARAQDGQPAATDAKQDTATMDFFRRTEVSGFVDTYYSYNFNTPATACATVGAVAIYNCLRNFAVTHNSFSLNFAELALEKKPAGDSRGGFRLDLDYGPTANIVHGSEPGGTSVFQNIEQASVSYLAPAGTGLQLDLGKFVTMRVQAQERCADAGGISGRFLGRSILRQAHQRTGQAPEALTAGVVYAFSSKAQ